MLSFRFLSVLLLPLYANGQVQTPPSNVSTGFVRLPNPPGQVNAFRAAPAPKQISWFYTPNGLVAYDGDIIFGTIAEFDGALVNVTYTSGSNTTTNINGTIERRHRDAPSPRAITERSNSLFPGSAGLWPNGKVPFRYRDDETESQLSQYVNPAIDAWTAAVPCLSFEKLPNSDDPSGSNGIVTIVANNPSAGVCFASLGYSPYSQWMGLDTAGACGVAEVKHEWGHILGLVHEQKRPDAFEYDPFVCSNLIDYPFGFEAAAADAQCCGAPPTYDCCGWACQFTADFGYYNLQDPVPENGGAFDLQSIMLYRNDAFAKPGTLTLLNGPNVYNNPQELSSGDINRVRELYGCSTNGTSQCPPACSPNPGENKCSWPTAQTCVFPSPSTPNPRGACACRAGFKATSPGIAENDTTKQWRLPADEGNSRVWVAEDVACDTPCEYSAGPDSCQEVSQLSKDCLGN